MPAVPLNAELIAKARDNPAKFVQACRIVREAREQNQDGTEDQVGLLNFQQAQAVALAAVIHNRWVMVVKYRQAKISTVMALWLLGQIQYNRGLQGVFVAERYETAETVWNRAAYAYEHLPPEIRIPLKPGTSAAKRELRFTHNGAVRVITGGGKAPAIGNSPDRIVVTEYPDVPDHENFNAHFFPTVNKRPDARVVFEHTPGLGNTLPHRMWLKCLDNKSRFKGVFLKWWLDRTIVPIDNNGDTVDCKSLVPTNEELAIIEQLPGVTKAHLMFRRLALDTEFGGDVELFRHKYPFDPLDGWVLTTTPAIPKDAVHWLIAKSVSVADNAESEYVKSPGGVLVPGDVPCWVFEEPEEDETPYVLVADPAGFGESGDPSALTVFNAWDKREVASWSGREDPGRFADRIMKVQRYYGAERCLVAVESNKGECVSALVTRNCPNLYYTSEHHPGFFASEQTNTDGRVAMVDLLRRKEMTIRTRATLFQILQWDGKTRSQRSKTAEGTHHFDRAVTVRIASYLFRTQSFGARPVSTRVRRGISAAHQKHLQPKTKRRTLGISTG